MNKSQIVVTRRWGDPTIRVLVEVDNKKISITMPEEEYKKAMLIEMGGIWKTLTRKQLAIKFEAAHQKVIQAMKDATADVMEGSASV